MSRAAAAATGMPSEGDPGDTTDRVHAPTAAAVPQAWDLEAADLGAGDGEAAEGADSGPDCHGNHRSTDMKSASMNGNLFRFFCAAGAMVCLFLSGPVLFAAQQSAAKKAPASTAAPAADVRSFETPQQASD